MEDRSGNLVKTNSLYEKTGLIVRNVNSQLDEFYRVNDSSDSAQYGYRRLLSWEKDENGEFKSIYKTIYTQEAFPIRETVFQYNPIKYEYFLQPDIIAQESMRILDKFKSLNFDPKISADQQINIKHPLLFNLRKPVENFSGRTEVLNELHKVLQLSSTTVVVTQAMTAVSIAPTGSKRVHSSASQASISGLGGIGKTQLALRYAELHAADYGHNVLWINSETKTDFANSLKKLADKLTIDTKDRYGFEKNLGEITAEIYAYFSDQKSLFIFDNVENYKEIEEFIPKVQVGNKPALLITSRYSNWKNIATVVSLDVFTELEAKAFIKTELNISDNTQDEKIKELNSLLQGLPLVLQQAMAYIDNQRNINHQFGISDYIELYKTKSQQLLGFDFSTYNNDPYTKTVLITWQVTMDKIRQHQAAGEIALEILNIMAYICPDNITNSLFLPLKNSETLATAIHLLKSYSMINQGDQQDISTIHRLVQKVVRINLEKDNNEFEKIAEKIVYLVGDYTKDKEHLYHFLYFLLHMSLHPELTGKLSIQATQKRILGVLIYSADGVSPLIYFFDAAHMIYSKGEYLNFIGEALFVYINHALLDLLAKTMDYIKKKLAEKILSKEDVREILNIRYNLSDKNYKKFRLSPDKEEKKKQLDALNLFYEFENKLFFPQESSACSSAHRKKRDTDHGCLFSSEIEKKQTIENQAKHQIIKLHLEKVSQIARLFSAGIFTKDMLSAMIQGNFSAVAINFGLIASSTILGEVSNRLLMQGERLTSADAALLLEKNLPLNGKPAFNVLMDEEVLSAGKRQFLGNTMKMAAPFIARGTSVFFAYNLINQVKIYNEGNQDMLPEIISNGVIVGVDGIESGIEAAEYLEVIQGISEFTGPLGEAVSALVWLGGDIYQAEQQVASIEKYVHLTRTEKFTQGIYAFLHLKPSEYLEVKLRNNLLVRSAIAFLKQHTDIKKYVFSADGQNSEVFLDKKTKVTLSETIPDQPSEGSLFCLSGYPSLITRPEQWNYMEPYPPLLGLDDEVSIYLCKNAIGVEYTWNRTAETTLIALDEWDDVAVADADAPSLFFVNNGRKNYRCGDKGCLFTLHGDQITGVFQGGRGVNLVSLEHFHPNSYILLDEQGFLCSKNKNVSCQTIDQPCESKLYMTNITQIHGRENKTDIIFFAKNVEYIDSYGGENQANPDYIYITDKSNSNLKLVLRSNTLVRFKKSRHIDTINYRIPNDQSGQSLVYLPFSESTQHRFYFEFSLMDLKAITIKDNIITFNFFYQQRIFNVTIVDYLPDEAMSSFGFPSNAYYIFQDDTEIKLFNKNNIYAQQRSNKTIDDVVSYYPSIASRLNMMLSIQLSTNEIVLIGHNKHEILSNNAFVKSHLIGNGGENIYVIRPETNHTNPFPIPEVTLYSINNNEGDFTNTLDLRGVFQRAMQACPGKKILFEISGHEQDLVITLNAHYYRSLNSCINLSMSTFPMATIRLKNALIDNWYEMLDIILHSVPMNIIEDDKGWHLEQLPLVFNRDKEIILVTDKDIEKNSELIILKNLKRYEFIRYNDTDLIISNARGRSITQRDLCTIIFSQFYQVAEVKEKLLSATLTFFDQQIVLKHREEEINDARNFAGVINQSTKKRPKRQVDKELIVSASLSTTVPTKEDSWLGQAWRWFCGFMHNQLPSLPKSSATKAFSELNAYTTKALPSFYKVSKKVEDKKSCPPQIKPGKMDVNGGILLADVLLARYANRKIYTSVIDESTFATHTAQAYALNIVEKFERVLHDTAIKLEPPVTDLDFDPVTIQSVIMRQLSRGAYTEIPKTLLKAAYVVLEQQNQDLESLLKPQLELEALLFSQDLAYLVEKQKSDGSSQALSNNRFLTYKPAYQVEEDNKPAESFFAKLK